MSNNIITHSAVSSAASTRIGMSQSEQQFLSELSADELNALLEESAAVRHGF